jgi:hypothetical protein
MNRREFQIAFTSVASINAGLTTIVIVKGVQYCIIGSFAPALFQLYIGAIGVYSVIRLMENIKKLEKFK